MKGTIFISVLMCFAYSLALPTKDKVFRSDYEYNKRTDAFYKLHIEFTSNSHAKEVCTLEGASLMIPDDKDDIAQLHGMLKQFPDLGDYVWVATDGHKHDPAEDTSIIYVNPSEDEPSERDTRLDCDVVTRSGDIESMACVKSHPFFCKVNAKEVIYNPQCDIQMPGYIFMESVHSCYRLPNISATWNEAYTECLEEGGHLLILNSETERLAVEEFLSITPKPKGVRGRYAYHAGYRAKKPAQGEAKVFKTILNQTLAEAGYEKWSEQKPNPNSDYYDRVSHCVSILFPEGLFAADECDHRAAFICEKEINPILNYAPYDDQCDVYALGYQYYSSVGSCYKVPPMALTWNEANAECLDVGAHLVILNSETEHQAVWDLIKAAPKVPVQDSFLLFAGIRAQKPREGSAKVFRTLFNETLQEAGYNEWYEEPNNKKSDSCGAIDSNTGNYHDVNCNHVNQFVCEKEVYPKTAV